MKIAIVGCGMIADAHVKEIRKIEDTEIVAVCDQEPLMAEQLADRYDIPKYFSNFSELVKKCNPDVVHILTPPSTHFPLGRAALEAGCHVLMEKPFTVNYDEAKALIDRAKELNRKITVNHFHNFSPPSLRLRELVSSGALGDVLHMEGFYSYGMKSPVAQALVNDKYSWIHQLPGKIVQNNIDHLICKFVEFIPDDRPVVWAHAKRISREARQVNHSHIHDELRVMITGENVSAYATFSSNINPFQHSLTVYGSRGTVHIDYESRSIMKAATSGLPGPFGKLVAPFHAGKECFREGAKNVFKFAKSDFHFYAGTNMLFKKFHQCISHGTEAPIPYKNILKITFIMDEIFRQINTRLQLRTAV